MRIVNIKGNMALSVGHIQALSFSSNQYTITKGTQLFSLMNIHVCGEDLYKTLSVSTNMIYNVNFGNELFVS